MTAPFGSWPPERCHLHPEPCSRCSVDAVQAEARQAIIDWAVEANYEGVLMSDIIETVLGDVPRLMLAVGAERVERSWYPPSQRWMTKWEPVSDDS